MPSAQQTRYFARIGPRASQLVSPTTGNAGVPGSVVVLPVTATASYLNLSTTFGQQPTSANANSGIGSWAQQISGLCSTPQAGIRLCIQAVTANVGLILGTLVGDVTGANAPVIATQGTLSSGTYTGAVGSCWLLLAGATIELEAFATQDVYLGFVGSTTGGLQIFQCSAPGA